MACSYEQIEVTGFTNPTGANGIYDKYTGPGALAVEYRKVEEDGTYYRIYGPAPFAGNTFQWAYWTASGDSIILQIASTAVGQSAICPDTLTWNLGSGITGTVEIAEYLEPQPNGNSEGNTFGLPAETVALITSRFGSVANFLRLRNQGQV
jgi:hypothetical protein